MVTSNHTTVLVRINLFSSFTPAPASAPVQRIPKWPEYCSANCSTTRSRYSYSVRTPTAKYAIGQYASCNWNVEKQFKSLPRPNKYATRRDSRTFLLLCFLSYSLAHSLTTYFLTYLGTYLHTFTSLPSTYEYTYPYIYQSTERFNINEIGRLDAFAPPPPPYSLLIMGKL